MSERIEILWRILIGIVSGIILHLWKIVICIVAVVHLIYVLITGKRNKEMAQFCNRWNTQAYKYIRYMTFAANERLFPFTNLGKDILPSDVKTSNKK